MNSHKYLFCWFVTYFFPSIFWNKKKEKLEFSFLLWHFNACYCVVEDYTMRVTNKPLYFHSIDFFVYYKFKSLSKWKSLEQFISIILRRLAENLIWIFIWEEIFYQNFKIKTSKAYCETKSLIHFCKIKQTGLQIPFKSIFHEKEIFQLGSLHLSKLMKNESNQNVRWIFILNRKNLINISWINFSSFCIFFFGKICCTFFCFFFCLIHFYSLLIIHCWAINIRHTVDEI